MIENLIKVMTPPEHPLATGSKDDWAVVEKTIGTILPDDYKEYISIYGIGRIGDFLWALNPFYVEGSANLMETMEYFQDSYIEFKRDFPEDFLKEVFPKDNSLLLWGMTDNGDFLYWAYDSNQNPNNWKVGITNMRDDEEYIFNMNMSTFLEKLVKAEIQTNAFPEDWLKIKNKPFRKL
ncbi:MAG: Unknown protein [uncultured Sulfurovum sp.]|uniref:Knr4/Smi1-like domain-containing protein n=1 Tax=uncultured Sulfurovum sp. TaxID=269237 RepID=A0A6S6U0A7_9BACT|nr:MAG: Unknown protein [uncultured Sulfurovum sp.]